MLKTPADFLLIRFNASGVTDYSLLKAPDAEQQQKLVQVADKASEAVKNVGVLKHLGTLPPHKMYEARTVIARYAIRGAVGGALIGAGCGALSPAPGGTAAGALIGCGVGMTGGAVYGCYRVYKDTRRDYDVWKVKQRDDVMREFLTIFKAHPAMDTVLCPIDLTPMDWPVAAKCGHYAGDVAFKKHIEKYHECFECRAKIKSVDELRVNYTVLGQMNTIYRSLLDDKYASVNLTANQREGIEALRKDTSWRINQAYDRELEEATKRFRAGAMTINEHSDHLKRVDQALADAAKIIQIDKHFDANPEVLEIDITPPERDERKKS